ncbi:hypothetical protein PC123_g24505 [Phytophthora cactorum]|nr:hypothetical protein PC123_g24505 [Phytophthora cactorum]
MITSTKLRPKTPLRPMPSQATRWNSTFVIVHRYFRFLEFINNDDTLTDFLPGPAANRRQRKFLGDLSKIESVSKELQPCSAHC